MRSGPDAFLALGEVQQLGSLVRLFGVATPGAQVTLEGTDFETTTTASERGRFVLNIVPDAVTAGGNGHGNGNQPPGARSRAGSWLYLEVSGVPTLCVCTFKQSVTDVSQLS